MSGAGNVVLDARGTHDGPAGAASGPVGPQPQPPPPPPQAAQGAPVTGAAMARLLALSGLPPRIMVRASGAPGAPYYRADVLALSAAPGAPAARLRFQYTGDGAPFWLPLASPRLWRRYPLCDWDWTNLGQARARAGLGGRKVAGRVKIAPRRPSTACRPGGPGRRPAPLPLPRHGSRLPLLLPDLFDGACRPPCRARGCRKARRRRRRRPRRRPAAAAAFGPRRPRRRAKSRLGAAATPTAAAPTTGGRRRASGRGWRPPARGLSRPAP
jgi:hypothetical protein